MRRVRALELISYCAFALGLAFLLACLMLPYVYSPQAVTYVGPSSRFTGDYAISGYYIPPVPEGAKLGLEVSGYRPGTLFISVFPTSEGEIAPSGPPLLNWSPTSASFTYEFRSPSTQPYGVYVVVRNGSSYVLTITGTWSPYYGLRVYRPHAVFLILLGLLSSYYFRSKRLREEQEERALQRLKAPSIT